jgi:hypothetical protein
MYKRLFLLALPVFLFACNPEEEDILVPSEPDPTEEVSEGEPADPTAGSMVFTDKDGNKTTMLGSSISLLADDGVTEIIVLSSDELTEGGCGATTTTGFGDDRRFHIAFVRNAAAGKNDLNASLINLMQPDGSDITVVSGFCYLDRTDPELVDQETGMNTEAGDEACARAREEMFNTDLEIIRFDDEVLEGTMTATYYIMPETVDGVNQVSNEELERYGEIITEFKVPAPARCN